MLKALVALIFIGAASILGWLSYEGQVESSSLNGNGFQAALINDLKLASKNKELPTMWNQISEVRYLYHSKKVQTSLDKSPIVATNKKGNKRLLVEFFDEPGSDDIIVVRYNVVDLKTGNTIGEINRRLKLPATPQSVEQLKK